MDNYFPSKVGVNSLDGFKENAFYRRRQQATDDECLLHEISYATQSRRAKSKADFYHYQCKVPPSA